MSGQRHAASSRTHRMAIDLCRKLAKLHIETELYTDVEGVDVAMVAVPVDGVSLSVWCEKGPVGYRFKWWSGDTTDIGLKVWTYCHANALEKAVSRIHQRYRELQGMSQSGLLKLACAPVSNEKDFRTGR
ncbi:hypothetical protein ACQP2T_60135 [Nonomuraea sp. CA-143628]|uniref:hypothetical protein n=1 Tax=Nonomuraea sp. CA-143628 TaxID=3239997 RepID=UPI003D937028